MNTIRILFLLALFLTVPFSKPQAQQEDLPGLQFTCLAAERCAGNTTCSDNHVHRVKLTPDEQFKAVASDSQAYITECLEVVNPSTNTPETLCTTGNSDLDKELFCGPDVQDPSACDFYSQLVQKINYSIDRDESYGIYHYSETSNGFEKVGPTHVSTDTNGNIIPNQIEWQSASGDAERRFLVWNKIASQDFDSESTDSGQKQGTLTFRALSEMCAGVTWDPEGIVFHAQTGMPIVGVNLSIDYSTLSAGPFTRAQSGLDGQLPPGTPNPLVSSDAGFYQFFGVNGYYTIAPQHGSFQHAAQNVTIPAAVRALYPQNTLYFSDSDPIEERGTKQVRHIPMTSVGTVSHTFQVLSNLIQNQSNGDVLISGRVNAPATLIIEICSVLSGVENCRDRQTLEPTNGGPSPTNNFTYELTQSQEELEAGESYKVTLEPWSIQQTQTRSFLDRLLGIVHAQESEAISFTVEPVPAYIEGYAYDDNGQILSNTLVGVYVPFSPTALHQVRTSPTGHFRITSADLPSTPFTIKYMSNNQTVAEVTTSQFLAQNYEFMKVEGIDPYLSVTRNNDPRRDVTPTFVPRASQMTPNGTSITPADNEKPTEETQTSPPPQNRSLLIASIVLFILGIGGIIAAVYIVRKRSNSNSDRLP